MSNVIGTVQMEFSPEDRALLREFIAATARPQVNVGLIGSGDAKPIAIDNPVSTPPAQPKPKQKPAESCAAAPSSESTERAASSPEKAAPVETPKSEPAKASVASSPAADSSVAPPAQLTIKDLQNEVLALVAIGKVTKAAKDETIAILAKYNAKQATQVRVDDYAAAHADLVACRAKYEAAAAA